MKKIFDPQKGMIAFRIEVEHSLALLLGYAVFGMTAAYGVTRLL